MENVLKWHHISIRNWRKGSPMSVRDLFIASIAIVNGLPIITLNSDFEVLKELGLEVYIPVSPIHATGSTSIATTPYFFSFSSE